MARIAALLRGVALDRTPNASWTDVKDVLAGLGFASAQAVPGTGNVVFDADADPGHAAGRVELALAARLGLDTRVTALALAELAEILDANPFGKLADDPQRLLVAVFAAPGDAERTLAPLARDEWWPDMLAWRRRAAYLWCPEGVLASKLALAAGRAWGAAAVTRTAAALTALRSLADATAPR